MSELAKALEVARKNNLQNMARSLAARIIAGQYPAPHLVRPIFG
jgi:hypothetical protein